MDEKRLVAAIDCVLRERGFAGRSRVWRSQASEVVCLAELERIPRSGHALVFGLDVVAARAGVVPGRPQDCAVFVYPEMLPLTDVDVTGALEVLMERRDEGPDVDLPLVAALAGAAADALVGLRTVADVRSACEDGVLRGSPVGLRVRRELGLQI